MTSAPPKPGRPRFQNLRVIYALILREMGAKFGRSAGGYAWAIAEPLGGILLLAITLRARAARAASGNQLHPVLRDRHDPVQHVQHHVAGRERGDQLEPGPAELSGRQRRGCALGQIHS